LWMIRQGLRVLIRIIIIMIIHHVSLLFTASYL
jgi:hypothetical protein